MRDNEYTVQVLRAFRTRFSQLNRNNDASSKEDALQMVNRVAESEDAVYLEGFKNTVLDLLGILLCLPGARVLKLRSHLVQCISEILEGNRDPRSTLPLLRRVMTVRDEFDEVDIWKAVGELVSQSRDKEIIFPFLQLPREIRSKIYVYAFENEGSSSIDQWWTPAREISAYDPSNPGKRLALLCANHQTHAEGIRDLFSKFSVRVNDIGTLHRLLNALDPATKSLLRSLDVRSISVKQVKALAYRLTDKNLTGMQNLRFECTEAYDGPLYFRGHGFSEYDKWPKYEGKLEDAVRRLFERNPRTNSAPSLKLCGFDDLPSENVTFPDGWNVSITSKSPARIETV